MIKKSASVSCFVLYFCRFWWHWTDFLWILIIVLTVLHYIICKWWLVTKNLRIISFWAYFRTALSICVFKENKIYTLIHVFNSTLLSYLIVRKWNKKTLIVQENQIVWLYIFIDSYTFHASLCGSMIRNNRDTLLLFNSFCFYRSFRVAISKLWHQPTLFQWK